MAKRKGKKMSTFNLTDMSPRTRRRKSGSKYDSIFADALALAYGTGFLVDTPEDEEQAEKLLQALRNRLYRLQKDDGIWYEVVLYIPESDKTSIVVGREEVMEEETLDEEPEDVTE